MYTCMCVYLCVYVYKHCKGDLEECQTPRQQERQTPSHRIHKELNMNESNSLYASNSLFAFNS